ncbi:CLUMA_CG010073, isoform A [Clunio marinus]|uniref:CLUMA_CG010073, isoform A n=1 Tax=Clunio marinus TaxID=568069 RepID=A0A1J1IA67_9DIPT|nr:CLUMA_CG010073, isoform A [Clunio marinus]
MCKIACNDPRCALYAGPVIHENVCNPSIVQVEVDFAECCNAEVERKVKNVKLGPIHIRSYNFCPPIMTSANVGIIDPPQPPSCF